VHQAKRRVRRLAKKMELNITNRVLGLKVSQNCLLCGKSRLTKKLFLCSREKMGKKVGEIDVISFPN
jgi:hypothetical protein